MSKYCLLIVSICFAGLTHAQKAIFTKAIVKSANVYSSGAELQNALSVNLPKGNSTVIVTNVAESIQENSIRILSSNSITILSSGFTNQVDSSYMQPIKDVKLKTINDSIVSVQSQLTKTNIELEAYRKSIELLDKNQTVLVGSNTSSVTQLNQLTDYYTNKRIDLSNKVENFQKKKTELERRITLLQESLKGQTDKIEKQPDGFIILQLNNNTAGNINMELSYLANNASWQPNYEIKGENLNSPLDVILKAKIIQNTGMDWKAVKLSLISGIPSHNSTAPILNPWYLANINNTLNDVVVVGYGAAKRKDVTGSTMMLTQKNLEAAPVANFNTTTNQLNTSYDVAIPYDIPSGDDGSTVQLQKTSIPAQYTYYTVPRYSTDAYLIAKIKDFNQYDLIEAPANIVFENMYIGETQIAPDQTNNELQITLGDDKRISVKKEKVLDKSGEKFLSSNREKTITYDLIVKNNKKEAIDIEIKDQLPVSNDNAIKIEMLENSLAEIDNEKGFMTWKVKIAPAETKKYRVSYKVRYPKDYTINL